MNQISSRPKGRTGCRTCRIRKVKCDEARPVCKRCSSTGRTCDGYEVPAGFLCHRANPIRRSILPKEYPTPAPGPSLLVPIRTSLYLTPAEAQGFAYFRDHTAREIPGCFASPFWHYVVLQLAHHEPAVLHAAIGVGAMHRSARGKSPSLQLVSLFETHHGFALRQYVKSINFLRSRLEDADAGGKCVETALVACLLFVCLEMLQGNRIGALAHLRNGFRILSGVPSQVRRDYDRNRSYLLVKQDRRAMVEQLAAIFARLDVDTTSFGERAPVFVFLMASPQDRTGPELLLPTAFQSVDEAGYFLDRLSNTAHHIRGRLLELSSQSCAGQKRDWAVQYCLEYTGIRRVDPARDPDLFTQLQDLRTNLTLWLAAFQHLSVQENTTEDSREVRAAIVLETRHFNISLQASTCQNDRQMPYDQFNSTFDRIVALSTFFVNGISSPRSNPGTPDSTFTLDSGVIPSLYLVAMKCRTPATRRRAISLLYLYPCQEGMWEPAMIARFVEEVANLECSLAASAVGCELAETARDVPEAARFSDVVLAATESPRLGRLVCARFLHGSTGELVVVEYLVEL